MTIASLLLRKNSDKPYSRSRTIWLKRKMEQDSGGGREGKECKLPLFSQIVWIDNETQL